MKALAVLALLVSQLSFATPRPTSIVMVSDPDFGTIGLVTTVQGAGESLLFEWSGNLSNNVWNFLASVSTSTVDQTWVISIPGSYFTGQFFVRVNGAESLNQFDPFSDKVRIKIKSPAIAIESK